MIDLHAGDCREVLASLPDASVDAVVTDPPYELGFMGKKWDGTGIAYDVGMWAEVLRVLKPGGHLLSFGGTRTWHRMACAVEDAGFEMRDSIAWLYGSGFPKSLDVGKAIDKAAGAEREVVGEQADRWTGAGAVLNFATDRPQTTIPVTGAPATPDAEKWDGWGTALKPAHEPIVVARKPLVGTVAANVVEHGTGALNIDGCRIGMTDEDADFIRRTARPNTAGMAHEGDVMNRPPAPTVNVHTAGRWPANVVLDDTTATILDADTGHLHTAGSRSVRPDRGPFSSGAADLGASATFPDSGGASRFFYCAKAPTKERPRHDDGTAHPTVKPLTLMRWLVRLVTPPDGTVLDPFTGSGTTLEAALLEGFHAIGIEQNPDYLPLIRQRLARHDATLNEDVTVTEPAAAAHPAKFSESILTRIGQYLDSIAFAGTILDPFAGVGRVHALAEGRADRLTFGVELEPEWAGQHPRTITGSVMDLGELGFGAGEIDAIVTSPVYGNRMSDNHTPSEADTSRRNTYKHTLGRDLSEGSAAVLQWGPSERAKERYKQFHRDAWREVVGVLKPGGLFVLNISDHIRGGQRMRVTAWHKATLKGLGIEWVDELKIETPRQRMGANGDARVECESVLIGVKKDG